MAEEPRTYPLVMELMNRSRLRWRWVMVVVAVFLLLLLVLLAYLDGVITDLSHWEFWREFLDGPTLILYILVVYPLIWQLWWRAVQSLQALLPVDEGSSKPVTVEGSPTKRHWEWVSIIIGAVFWVSLWQPWAKSWHSGVIWLSAYDVFTQTILFGLLAWLLYSSFSGNRYINRLGRQQLNLDIFNTSTLAPVARSSLGITVVFIGGISLSLVFQTQEDLLMWNNILVWSILVCFVVLLFFLSMWSIHNVMGKVKKEELEWIQKHLKESTLEFKQKVAEGKLVDVSALSSTVNFWMTYERRIKETSDWPFNPSILRRLTASIVAPVAVFFIKVLPGLGVGT